MHHRTWDLLPRLYGLTLMMPWSDEDEDWDRSGFPRTTMPPPTRSMWRECMDVLMALGYEEPAAETLVENVNGDLATLVRRLVDGVPADQALTVTPLVESATYQGIPNYGNSCYIDSLVFAMFATIDAFDVLLLSPVPSPANARRLQVILSFCVSLLRTGLRVPRAVGEELRDAIFAAGFCRLGELREQHDAFELFIFLMETLRAPSFTLKQMFFHGGVAEGGDEQRVADRVLQVSMPENSGAHSQYTLEQLLQEHFSNPVHGLHRRVGTAEGVKEVDAWRMMSMLPFIRLASEAGPSSDTLPTRLVLPIILKRYCYGPSGPERVAARVIVPPEIDFTPFVYLTSPPTNLMYTLRLVSVVCHEGNSVDRGHYTTWANHGGQWLRFDDNANGPLVHAERRLKEVTTMMHSEMATNGYIFFYELVSDAGIHPHIHADARIAAELQAKEYGRGKGIAAQVGESVPEWCRIV